jgi:O-antigen ligase
MTNEQIIYTVGIGSGVIGLIAYIAFILVPAWGSYSRIWQRLAASFLTLYVLAAFVIAGAAGGAAIVYFWDRIGT